MNGPFLAAAVAWRQELNSGRVRACDRDAAKFGAGCQEHNAYREDISEILP